MYFNYLYFNYFTTLVATRIACRYYDYDHHLDLQCTEQAAGFRCSTFQVGSGTSGSSILQLLPLVPDPTGRAHTGPIPIRAGKTYVF